MQLVDKLTKENCGSDITIKEDTAYYAEGHINNAVGRVAIDGMKYPNATYKWTIQAIRYGINYGRYINIDFGISPNRNNLTARDRSPPSYWYCYSGGIFSGNKRIADKEEYCAGDTIAIKVDIKAKTVTFLKNDKFVYTIRNIDISKKYWLVISLSKTAAKLVGFEFNKGNIEEEKQDIKYGINSAKLIEDLQNELLNKIEEIDQIKKINKDINEKLQESQIKLISSEQRVNELEKIFSRSSSEKQILQNQVNELKKLNESLLNQQEDEKKNDEMKGLKNDLISLADKMNEFNTKYNENALCTMYNNNPDSLFVEQDINNTELSCKSLGKHLQDIEQYVVSVTRPDVSKYNTWDMNTIIIWIKSLDKGKFIQYSDILRKGFELDGIGAEDLPSVGQSDLRVKPFEIQSFKDRKKLAQYFKSLEQNQIATANNEGGQTVYI